MHHKSWLRIIAGAAAIILSVGMTGLHRGVAEEAISAQPASFPVDEPLRTLFESPEIQPFQQFMIHRADTYTEKIKGMTLTELADGSQGWDAEGMAYGINHLLDLIHSGVQVDQDIYTAEEMAATPDLTMTKLFCLPGQEGAPYVPICAGGGFTSVCTMVEAFPTAARLNELGYNVFCLSYRHDYPVCQDKSRAVDIALEDVAAAIRWINQHAEELHVDAARYAVCGFLGGARLLSKWGLAEEGYGKYDLAKPSCMFLNYQGGWIADLITADYPPSYVTYATNDTTVTPDVMEALVNALQAAGVPCETWVGDSAGHGYGLGMNTEMYGWVDQAVAFWEKQ